MSYLSAKMLVEMQLDLSRVSRDLVPGVLDARGRSLALTQDKVPRSISFRGAAREQYEFWLSPRSHAAVGRLHKVHIEVRSGRAY